MASEGDQLTVSAGNLAAGIYYVQAISANGKAHGKMKFIKMNWSVLVRPLMIFWGA